MYGKWKDVKGGVNAYLRGLRKLLHLFLAKDDFLASCELPETWKDVQHDGSGDTLYDHLSRLHIPSSWAGFAGKDPHLLLYKLGNFAEVDGGHMQRRVKELLAGTHHRYAFSVAYFAAIDVAVR